MRSDSYTVSSALRTWHQVYTIYQNRRAFAVQRNLARVQYDALLKWRIQLRAKMKLLKQARFVENFILQRRILKAWKVKFEERQRQKKLEHLEIRRLRTFMTGKVDASMIRFSWFLIFLFHLKHGTRNIKECDSAGWQRSK